MRVGRSALDEDAIRLLEEYNPDVEFDWTRILKGQPEPENQGEGKGKPEVRRERGPRRPEWPPQRDARPGPVPSAPAVPPPIPAAPVEDVAIEPELEAVPELPPSASLARLGAEGLLRLRARYAEVMTRINDRVMDDGQREELKAKAERLNPDAWVTDDEVRLGLDAYEATFEELRAVIGRPRKRRRRRGSAGPPRTGSPDAAGAPSLEAGAPQEAFEESRGPEVPQGHDEPEDES